ncbi:MAG TPA: hypothetical protein VIK74_05025 [Parasegetibacter sp.]
MILQRLLISTYIFSAIVFSVSCGDNSSDSTPDSILNKPAEEVPDAAGVYISVQLFVDNQIDVLKDMPRAIMRYTTTNGNTDSGYISLDEFAALAAVFGRPDFSSEPLKKWYKETSFVDETLNMITFNYQALKDTLELQRADILLTQETTGNKVSSVYMEKQIPAEDGTVFQKLYWKADSHFQIIRTEPSRPDIIAEKIRVVWKL